MNLPSSFINDIRSLLGDGEFENFAAALRETPPASIRINRDKPFCDSEQVESREQVPWAAHGYYLDERLTFTFDPLFHAGVYYVQEASSMFVGQALRQYVTKPVVMLDLCAAPGGKSTHARSVLPEGSLLVANEVIRNRSQVLAENLTKWGHSDVVVTNNDPADFSALPYFFDVILADVPCSGEGMFRKDAAAVEEWSPENVEICRQRQRRIVADIWPCLKPGGLLIYSTCTYNTKEDEENVRWIRRELGAESLPLDICPEWGITGNLLPGDEAPVFRFLPHKTKGEGFFLAVLRKPAEEAASDRRFFPQAKAKKKEKKEAAAGASLVSKENLTTAARWLKETVSGKYTLAAEGAGMYAFPHAYAGELAAMKQVLRVIQRGVAVAEVKGKDIVPAHSLAMSSQLLNRDVFPSEEIGYEQAIAYLRKEVITFPPSAPRGFVLLTYRHIPLGFVKNIGNRANNLYPQEWRIRSGYMPEEVRTL